MLRKVLASLVILCLVAASLQAAPIPLPNAAYTSSTTLINISGIPNSTGVNSITDGVMTVGFSSTLDKRQVPSGNWSTWSSPPFSETATPHVLFSTGSSLTLTLSKAASIFGFELEPNNFGNFLITTTFSNGDVIAQLVNGNAGARLFASGGGSLITSVNIQADSGAAGFAIAQIRYSLATVPEPASILAWGFVAGGCCVATRLRRRSKPVAA